MSSAPVTFPCPDHPSTLTPTQARALALQLLTLAEEAGGPADSAVTAAQVRLELAELRAQAATVERALATFIATTPPSPA